MTTFERSIQKRIVDAAAEKYGTRIWIRVKHGDAYATVGDPDIYGCLVGSFFVMEVKNETGELSRIQKIRLQEVREARGFAFAVQSVDEAIDGLTGIERSRDWSDY